jgi:molybdate transport system permease protein
MLILSETEWSALKLSLLLAGGAALVTLPPGVLLGWLLARRQFPYKLLVEILVFLPLVTPPVVTGYIILIFCGRHGWLGKPLLDGFGLQMVFAWPGMLLAAAASGFPLLVRSVRTAIEGVDVRLEQAAATLGFPPWRVFWRITLPLAWPGVLAGSVLCFARAVGEFGATRVVGMNTDGHRTLPLEIYYQIDAPDGTGVELLRLVLLSLLLSAGALCLCEFLLRRKNRGSTP